MAFCEKCGTRIDQHESFCPICGTANTANDPENEKAGCCWTCLSFTFPMIGFILWLAWKNYQPTKATTVCFAAWIGLSVSLFLNLVALLAGTV